MQYIIDQRNLIFDFDGTITLYDEYVNKEILKEFFLFSNLKSFDDFISFYHNSTSDFEFVNKAIVKNEQKQVLNNIIKLNMKQVESKYFDPVIKETLLNLSKKYNLFIITGRDYYSMNHALKINKLDNFFIEVICSDNNIKAKPSPDKGLKLLKKYNLNLHNTFYIGDKYTDAQFSENLKFNFIGAHWINQHLLENYMCCNNITNLEKYID